MTSGDYVWMIFCLGDGIFWEDLDSRKGITMEKQEVCVYTGHGGFESIRYAQNATYDFRTVKVPRKIFTALTDDYLGGLTAARLERKVTEDVLHVSLSPQMARVLAELGDAENYPGGLGTLFLDGKLSELFAVVLGAAITDDCAAFRAPTLFAHRARSHPRSKTHHRCSHRLCAELWRAGATGAHQRGKIVAWIFSDLWSVVASICDRRTARDGRATAFGK